MGITEQNIVLTISFRGGEELISFFQYCSCFDIYNSMEVVNGETVSKNVHV